MNSALLKQNGKTNYKKKQTDSIVVALIMTFFASGASLFSSSTTSSEESLAMMSEEAMAITMIFLGIGAIVGSLISIFLAPIFTVGGNRYFLKLRKNVTTGIGEVTGNFKDGNYWSIVKTTFFKNLKIFLWTLLFIIPGIIKSFEYFLVEYILAVRPDIDSKTALNMSKNLMNGHKLDAFVLGLSFIGWQLLGVFTCGILNIAYVNPYFYATMVEFYCFVRAEGIRNGIITPMDLPDYEPPVDTPFFNNGGFGVQQPQYQQPQYQQPQYQQPQYQEPQIQATEVSFPPQAQPPQAEASSQDTQPLDE